MVNDRPWYRFYDPGVPRSLEYPPIPFFRFLEDSARRFPDRPALIFKPAHQGFAGSAMTYRELNELSDRMAAALYHELGVRKGDRVALIMPNIPQFVIAYFAVQKIGGVVVATNPIYTPREMEYQLADSGATVAIVLSRIYERVKSIQPNTQVRRVVAAHIKEFMSPLLKILYTLARERKEGDRVTLRDNDVWFHDLLQRYRPDQRPTVEVGPDDVAIFQYTGGTTGLSKGAVALHRNIVANVLQVRSWDPQLREGQEVIMGALPLFHAYGMIVALGLAMQTAATLVLVPNPRDLHTLLDGLQRYRVTMFPGVPTLYNAINNHPDVKAGKYNLRTIRACISGAAPLLLEIKRRFEEITGAKLVEGYGLSEAPTATHCNPLYGLNKEGSIGIPMPDVDAKIVSLEDGVTELPPGEIGELVLRGPQVFQGYWNRPTETENTLRNGWLYTGDIARMDEDGYFYIVDRKKEVIKPGGYQVWPREVEEILAQHPKIKEVAVAGIPDPHLGEAVKAWVVLHEGQTATAEEIREWCRDKLAPYKIPRHVEFRTELPKSMVGKVLRRVLVEEERTKSQPAE
ncbi:long-chain fatty acid--CoA ligase [Thermoflexus sp.]|uniref:long-chain-fatty-acid--CoA ligase n=1 Tax=Thermoflexus sp. TaxID=1969742 RepID=UPI002ADE586E|nr:long-chain fatty acid--CoA ligase [Thermoflexus sp.]